MTDYHYNPDLFWAKVDKTGDCWLWTASAFTLGYGQFGAKVNGVHRPVVAHRVAWQEIRGTIPEGMMLDHKCFVKLCVNPDHLRLATGKQNQEHRPGPQANSASGIRGVFWAKRQRKWKAAVKHDGKLYSLGYFKAIGDAEAAAVAKRNELFTHNDMDRQAV